MSTVQECIDCLEGLVIEAGSAVSSPVTASGAASDSSAVSSVSRTSRTGFSCNSCWMRSCNAMIGNWKLVDFLLAARTETALAEGDSHQIPLNPNVAVTLPSALKRPGEVKSMEVDFTRAAGLWDGLAASFDGAKLDEVLALEQTCLQWMEAASERPTRYTF